MVVYDPYHERNGSIRYYERVHIILYEFGKNLNGTSIQRQSVFDISWVSEYFKSIEPEPGKVVIFPMTESTESGPKH